MPIAILIRWRVQPGRVGVRLQERLMSITMLIR
jgi:hypothetical protein